MTHNKDKGTTVGFSNDKNLGDLWPFPERNNKKGKSRKYNPKVSLQRDKELKELAIEYADGFGKDDDMTSFIAGWNCAMNKVLTVLHENYSACKNLTDEDKVRSAQEIVNETYEDLILIFMP